MTETNCRHFTAGVEFSPHWHQRCNGVNRLRLTLLVAQGCVEISHGAEHSDAVMRAVVRDFTETKLFGAGLVGLGTLGTSYHAGVDSVSLIALSLLAV
jgi:hypothetical protein